MGEHPSPRMRRLTLIILLFATISLFAQKRIEPGIFIDYLNISQTSTNNFGLGGRFGYRVHHDVIIEGELAYDYGINFDELPQHRKRKFSRDQTHIDCVTHGLLGPKSSPQVADFVPSLRSKRIHGFPSQPQPGL